MPFVPPPATVGSAGGIGSIEFGFPSMSRAMVFGITFAIAGNVLISFALNLQKLAHARLEEARAERGGLGMDAVEHEGGANSGVEAPGTGVQHESALPPELEREARVWSGNSSEASLTLNPHSETDPLMAPPVTQNAEQLTAVPTYGALFSNANESHVGRIQSSPLRQPPKTAKQPGSGVAGEYTNRPTDQASNNESEYLKSKMWWLGFLLMNIGETGNFISYAFAPASVVAPLGTFALIANCLFAPLLLHERLRTRDISGVVLAMIGAITVVLASNMSDTRLSPETLLKAVLQHVFLIFSAIYVVIASILMGLSEGGAGRKWVLVDVGLCALFGGFTVLATKAVSMLLTTNGFNMFKLWMTYPFLAVLIGTGIGQIKYLNRALMRFDSKVVVPTQFVLFNLSAITGSAILYGDFKTVKFHQFVTFMYGCAATFAGVWIIAWVPTSEEPSTGPDDQFGATRDTETMAHDVYIADGVSTGGSVGRRPGNVPVLRPRQSTVSLVGISPAQRLLLVHTPPRPEVQLGHEHGVAWEAEPSGRGRSFDGSMRWRHAITWVVDRSPTPRSRTRLRSVERRWMTNDRRED